MGSERTTLVDSNVLFDVVTDDPVWSEWSADALDRAFELGAVAINPIVYAEVSVRYEQIEDVDDALAAFTRLALPYAAGFLAGKAYLEYRRRGGTRTAPLADFYIGAHAAVSGYRLLTRDAKRFRTYFPSLELVAP